MKYLLKNLSPLRFIGSAYCVTNRDWNVRGLSSISGYIEPRCEVTSLRSWPRDRRRSRPNEIEGNLPSQITERRNIRDRLGITAEIPAHINERPINWQIMRFLTLYGIVSRIGFPHYIKGGLIICNIHCNTQHKAIYCHF